MQNRLVIALGALIGLLAFPHAFLGWPELLRELKSAGVGPELYAPLGIGWCFGSLTMLTLGLLVIFCGRAGGPLARRCALLVGVAYVCVGAGAMLYRGVNLHFVGFFVLGAGLCASAWRWRVA